MILGAVLSSFYFTQPPHGYGPFHPKPYLLMVQKRLGDRPGCGGFPGKWLHDSSTEAAHKALFFNGDLPSKTGTWNVEQTAANGNEGIQAFSDWLDTLPSMAVGTERKGKP